MKLCPKCSTEFDDNFKFCRDDGTALQTKVLGRSCPNCGTEAEERKKFCSNCGASLKFPGEAAKSKTETAQNPEVARQRQPKSESSEIMPTVTESRVENTPTTDHDIEADLEQESERISQTTRILAFPSTDSLITSVKQSTSVGRRKASGILLSVGIIVGVVGILAGGLLAYYGQSRQISVTNLLEKFFSGNEQSLGLQSKLPGKSNVPQVFAAKELGFTVLGDGADDANRSDPLISQKIQSQLEGIRNLYQRQIQAKPDLMGIIRLQLTISQSGQVTKAEEVDARIDEPEFKKAVVQEASAWRFPEATLGEVKVTSPLLFIPPGMDAGSIVKWEQSVGLRMSEPIQVSKVSDQDTGAPPALTKDGSSTSSASGTTTTKPPAPARSKEPTTVTYETLYPTAVYPEPRQDSQEIASIPAGIKVNVVGVRGEWLEVRSKHGNPPGFIKKDSAAPIASR